jgi:hypothetical protein
LNAAVAYLEAGKRKQYVAQLMKYFGEMPLMARCPPQGPSTPMSLTSRKIIFYDLLDSGDEQFA